MNMSSLSIDRPVMATVISIVIVLFGYIGFRSLGLREYPSVDPPVVSVQTNYTGAAADVIESQITEPLEESINGIAGIRSLSSTCSDGRSSIRVEFELGIDLKPLPTMCAKKCPRHSVTCLWMPTHQLFLNPTPTPTPLCPSRYKAIAAT
jgi:hypothetical protein